MYTLLYHYNSELLYPVDNFPPSIDSESYVLISQTGEFHCTIHVNDSNGDPFTVTVNVDNSTILIEDNQVNISGVIEDLDSFSNFTVSATVCFQ